MCSLWPHSGGICYSRWSWGWVRRPCRQNTCQCTNNALSVGAKVVWKRGKCRQGLCICVCGGGGRAEPQGCRVLEASHSRCGKRFPSLQNTGTHLCTAHTLSHTYKHRPCPMGDNRKRNGTQQQTQQQGQKDSGRVWMMSWVAPPL